MKEELELFDLVFEHMNDVFVFLGMKFMFAFKPDMERELHNRGLQGFLADCTIWTHVKEEVQCQKPSGHLA
jgi:hypothetical protein